MIQTTNAFTSTALLVGSEFDDISDVFSYMGLGTEQVSTGVDALQRLNSVSYELVVCIEINFSKAILSFCQSLRRRNPLVPLAIICKNARTEDRVFALDVGADEFLNPEGSQLELRARLGALLRRFHAHRQAVSKNRRGCHEVNDLKIDLDKKQAYLKNRALDLTPSEYTLLEVLILESGKTLSQTELGAKLWGFDSDVYDENIKWHISRLRKKLGSKAADESYILTIRGKGYRIAASD